MQCIFKLDNSRQYLLLKYFTMKTVKINQNSESITYVIFVIDTSIFREMRTITRLAET